MARIRTIKPEFFDDEDIAALSMPARLAFIGLWLEADREGRLRDRPVRLKARIFPFDAVDMTGLLDELEAHRFIRRYQAGEAALITIRTFQKHQHVNPREPESGLPAPPDDERVLHVQEYSEQVHARVEGKGREGKGKGTEESAVPQSVTTPPVLTFPVVGVNGSAWDLTPQQCASWAQAYPDLDVLAECRKALAWLDAKPGRRKTPRGMPAFLVGWLNRATDRGPSRSDPVAARRPSPSRLAPWTPSDCWHRPPCRDHAEHKARAQVDIRTRIAQKQEEPTS